jgi:2'-5' RNA ligase
MRLFVAIDLSDEIRENIFRLSKILGVKGVKIVERENIHLTLKFLGEVNKSKKDRVIAALEEIEFKGFRVNFKGVGFFPNASKVRVIWVGVDEGAEKLTALAYAIEDKMAELKFKKERRFVPHATIARVKGMEPNTKATLLERLAGFESEEFGEMEVTHFALKKSTLTPKGPIYEDVKLFRPR